MVKEGGDTAMVSSWARVADTTSILEKSSSSAILPGLLNEKTTIATSTIEPMMAPTMARVMVMVLSSDGGLGVVAGGLGTVSRVMRSGMAAMPLITMGSPEACATAPRSIALSCVGSTGAVMSRSNVKSTNSRLLRWIPRTSTAVVGRFRAEAMASLSAVSMAAVKAEAGRSEVSESERMVDAVFILAVGVDVVGVDVVGGGGGIGVV